MIRPSLLAVVGAVLLAAAVHNRPQQLTPFESIALAQDTVAAASEENELTVDKLAERQRELKQLFGRFHSMLVRWTEVSQFNDPRRAAALRRITAQAQERRIEERFEQVATLIAAGRLADAIEQQASLEADLQSLLESLLKEVGKQERESLRRLLQQLQKEIILLLQEQKQLQAETESGRPFAPLADRQADLAQRANRTAGKLGDNSGSAAQSSPTQQRSAQSGTPGGDNSGDKPADSGQPSGNSSPGQSQKQEPGGSQSPGAPGSEGESAPQQPGPIAAQNRLRWAYQHMKEAEQRLRQAQRAGAVEEQEEAIRQLERAKAELERILRQLRQEEIAQLLAALEARFRYMLSQEKQIYRQTQELDKTPADKRDRTHRMRAEQLSTVQADLVQEVDKALTLLYEDGSAPALTQSTEQVRTDMQQVVILLADGRVGQLTQTLEEDIIRSLEEIVEALQQEQRELRNRNNSNNVPSAPDAAPLVSILNELKMIRALQLRVNRRTTLYSEMLAKDTSLTQQMQQALNQLAERQRKIAEITHDLHVRRNR